MLMNELLDSLFDGQAHALISSMTDWLASSRRFAAFVNTHRDKIRKKLRTIRDSESLLDLRLELETAYLLLRERTLNLAYELQPAGQSGRTRAPDYAVTYTTSFTFMVEVTRIRSDLERNAAQHSNPEERIAETICGKLVQLLPQRSNVLIIGVESLTVSQTDLQAMMLRIKQRAEHNDPAFFKRLHFRDRATFFTHYQRLSEVIVRGSGVPASNAFVAGVNPQSKYTLPARVRTALHRSHDA